MKNEIALSYLLKRKYHLDQKITFEKPGILKNRTYKMVSLSRANSQIKIKLVK